MRGRGGWFLVATQPVCGRGGEVSRVILRVPGKSRGSIEHLESGFQVHAHTLDTGGEPGGGELLAMHCVDFCRSLGWMLGVDILDKLLSLDIGHAVDTGNTITIYQR